MMAQILTCVSIIVLTLSLYSLNFFVSGALDPNKFLVWGPGLRSGFVVPAKYFFVQAVTDEGKK